MKDPLTALPTEVLLQILLLLDPVSICLCCRISKAWRSLCESDLLWQTIAIHLGYNGAPCYISSDGSKRMTAIAATLEQHPVGTSSDHQGTTTSFQKTLDRFRQASVTSYFDDCNSFKKLCCKLWMLECNWSGRYNYENRTDWEASHRKSKLPVTLNPKIRRVAPEGIDKEIDIYRFKLDPVERTIIAYGFGFDIIVFDQDTFHVLWRLPPQHVRNFAHLEFSNGYLAFNSTGYMTLEVYQSERVAEARELQQPPRCGHFCFLKRISVARDLRAFRLQYPYLAVNSSDRTISFFELPSFRLAHKFNCNFNANYIDFDEEYVFIVGIGAHAVSVFSRETGEMVWNMGQHFVSGHAGPLTWSPNNRKNQEPHFADGVPFVKKKLTRVAQNCWQRCTYWHLGWQLPPDEAGIYQVWYFIQPDIKTKTLCILGQGTLVMLRDYKKFFRDTSKEPDMFAEIEFRDLTYGEDLGWNDDERWGDLPDAQLTVHDGKAFIVNEYPMIVDLENPGPTCGGEDRDRGRQNQQDEIDPLAEPCQFAFYDYRQPYYFDSYVCSSVQMDQTGIYFVDVDVPMREEEERVIRHFDFTQRNEGLLGQIRDSDSTSP